MNKRILYQEVQNYIDEHLKSDLHKLILKGSHFDEITVQELANQIVSKQKCEKKLPNWFQTKNIYYPPKLNIEQTSSELTAQYKSELVAGKTLIDMTGGYGVDSFFFSKKIETVTHCEINKELSEIATHNFKQLNAINIKSVSENGVDFIKNSKDFFDVIYIDPSRRNDAKGKVFLLRDCEPNVPDNMSFLFEKTNTILIKNSPILDITSAINELSFVKEIHIIAINNDVKELLFLLEKDYKKEIQIKTINFTKSGSQEFNFQHQTKPISTYSKPLEYLYEPNAAILKSGGFHEISNQLNIFKLHQHSHLYTSEKQIEFPGRVFKVIEITSYDKKKIAKLITNKKANITTRNFPKTVAQIRKELKIKDGGEDYLFFTTNFKDELICIHSKKV